MKNKSLSRRRRRRRKTLLISLGIYYINCYADHNKSFYFIRFSFVIYYVKLNKNDENFKIL